MWHRKSSSCFGGALVSALVAAAVAQAAPPAAVDHVSAGNELYKAGRYDKALEAYKQASVDCEECPEIAYNEALAHYRMRDFEKARELFNETLSTRDSALEAKAKFNLGNTAYSQALEKLNSLKEAISFARQAIDYYADSLDINPDDDAARANIETAQLLIKDLLDKQKKQQEEQKKNDQQQQDQNKQDQQQQGQQQKQDQKDQQQDKNQQSDKDKQDEQKKQQKQDQQQQQQQQRDEQQQNAAQQQDDQQQSAAQQQATDSRELSPEEAERLLQAVRDKEAQRRDDLTRRRHLQRPKVTRDW